DQDLADEFDYIGEGLKGDQRLTAANKALVEAIVDNRPIYGFWQEKSGGKYEYIGKLAIKSYSYELSDGRKVYKFKIFKI
ncbi:MAG: restriction endonuclease, partial [Candidatus Pacebacteria bacterium]|nr:restriction endonuclease [Candidatus Paceibacterota bacterium]